MEKEAYPHTHNKTKQEREPRGFCREKKLKEKLEVNCLVENFVMSIFLMLRDIQCVCIDLLIFLVNYSL